MKNYREQYLSALTKKVCDLMAKDELTQQDIEFIILYKRELKRAEFTPIIKRVLNGAQDVLAFIKKLNLNNDEIGDDDDGV